MIVTDANTFYPDMVEPEAPPEVLVVRRWRFGDSGWRRLNTATGKSAR